MKEIDADPRSHSHLYEIKPMKRRWILPPIGLVVVGAYLGSLGSWELAALSSTLGGLGVGFGLLLCFPKEHLTPS